MKICDIVQFYSALSGGVKRYIHDKSAWLARGDDEHVLIVPGPVDRLRRLNRTRVYEIASPPLWGSRSYRILLARRRIAEIVRMEAPDLIETDAPYRSAWTALAAARASGAAIVGYYHSDYPRAIGRTAQRLGLRRCEPALTRGIERYLKRLYNRMDATLVASERFEAVLTAAGVERVIRAPLGIDTAVFAPQPRRDDWRAGLGVRPDETLLICAGRLAREKNIAAVLDMMAGLSERRPGCRLLLVGDGELRALVRRHEARRRDVLWIGHCSDPARLAQLYSAADVLVHAGTSETFGLVSLEAQACGARVLGVAGGGLEDTLDTVARADMASAATGPALAEALDRLLARPDRAEARAARAARVREQCGLDRAFGRLRACYAEQVAAVAARRRDLAA